MTDRTQNLVDMKQRITSFMKIRGPVLPIHISKETKTTLLVASAFLSDLASEKTIKISDMKVGGSPLYYLPGQENMLENFEKFLNHKEREALSKLKQSKVLKDDEQEPAIRVALRSIKDFARPYTIKFQDRQFVFWQYFSLPEEEAEKLISEKLEKYKTQIVIEEKPEVKEQTIEIEIEEKPKIEEVIEPKEEIIKPEVKEQTIEIEEIFPKLTPTEPKQVEITSEKAEEKIKKPVKKREKIKPDRFLEEIKSFLAGKNIELIRLEKNSKKEIIAVIKEAGKDVLLLALDKKRVDEEDLLKTHKKSQVLGMPYRVITKGETSKKLKDSIDAYKNLEKIEKME